MNGFLIKYKAIDDYKRVIFNHSLFGRLIYQNYRGKKYAYYSPGMLDDTLFVRIKNGVVFLSNIDNVDFDILSDYATCEIEECEQTIFPNKLQTGKQYWEELGKKRGLNVNVKNKK